jgi:hypothetical protein
MQSYPETICRRAENSAFVVPGCQKAVFEVDGAALDNDVVDREGAEGLVVGQGVQGLAVEVLKSAALEDGIDHPLIRYMPVLLLEQAAHFLV